MKQIVIIIACMLACGMQACKKTDTAVQSFDNDPIKTKTLRYFTQLPWKQTTLEYQNQNGTWATKPLNATQLAYVYSFKTTGYSDGTYAITANNNAISTGTWSIIGDNNQVVFDLTAPTYDFATLNDTAMQLQISAIIPYTDPATGITTQYYSMRETFSH